MPEMNTDDQSHGKYEHGSRLIDEKDLQDLWRILGLKVSSLNNCQRLPVPQLAGAGRVKPFSEERIPYPERPIEASASRSTGFGSVPFRPKPGSCDTELEDLVKEWPGYQTCDQFSLPAEEVKKRAAWAWYRTGIICSRAARRFNDSTPCEEEVDGHPADRDSPMKPANALAIKAANAKSEALRLYPRLLEKETLESPTWCGRFTEVDEKFYLELETNYKNIQRVTVSQRYKQAANAYAMEALDLYLEWKQEQEIKEKGSAAKNIRDFMLDQMSTGDFASLTKLWDDAAEWGLKGPGAKGPWQSHRRWWTRAALARGHAEWLLRERIDARSSTDLRPTESWRLAAPMPVGFYENDCGIFAILGVIAKEPEDKGPYGPYPDDVFETSYNITHHEAREFQSIDYGWENVSCWFGPPDFVLQSIADEGLHPGTTGLFSSDACSIGVPVGLGVYDRYMRRGLASCLPSGSSNYEHILARAADDLILEMGLTTFSNAKDSEYRKQITPDRVLSQLDTLLTRRQYMTALEANRNSFARIIFLVIKTFLNQLQDVLARPPGAKEHEFLFDIENKLAEKLVAWFEFKLFETTGGRILFYLRELETSYAISDLDENNITFRPVSEPVLQCIENSRLTHLDYYLEQIRTEILNGNKLSAIDLAYIRPFREFLESGCDPACMPLVHSGSKWRREIAGILGLFKSDRMKCKPNCECPKPMMMKTIEAKVEARKSVSKDAVTDRALIRAFFANHDKVAVSK